MTTSRLSLYNGALRLLGDRQLASASENRESRRILDAAWDDGAVNAALEAGQWLFACRSMMYDYSPSVEPPFGYRRAFNKPDDFVRTMAVCSDEYFNTPIIHYTDEVGYWFCDLDTIYVRFVSNDPVYGGDMSRWPQSFVKYLEAILARDAAMPLKQNESARNNMIAIADKMLVTAKSQNAMADPVKFPPKGSWVGARSAGYGRFDRGRGY